MKLLFSFILSTIGFFVFAQNTYYSKAIATNFNDINSWGENTDGSGASPASISNLNNFVIRNSSNLTLNGNATVRNLKITTGTLNVNADTLKVEIAAANNTEFLVQNNATLNLGGTGTIDVRGAVYFETIANFNQNGGLLLIDGNSGQTSTSYVGTNTATRLFGIGFTTGGVFSNFVNDSTKFNLNSGIIRIVDPPLSTLSLAYAVSYRGGTSIKMGANHTFEFGDGVSTQSGSSSSGFAYNLVVNGGTLLFGNIVSNSLNGTNRKVSFDGSIQKNLTILSGEFVSSQSLSLGGNLINEGTFISNNLAFENKISTFTVPTYPITISQSISGNGIFKEYVTSGVAELNFSAIKINNSSSTGVVFSNANSLISGGNLGTALSVDFTNGTISTNGLEFILGASTTKVGNVYNATTGGFVSGTPLTIWKSTNIGSLTAGTQPGKISNTGLFPFVFNKKDRSVFIQYSGATSGGKITITHNANGSSFHSTTITDGTYTVQNQSNDSWTLSQMGITGLTSFVLGINGQDIYKVLNGNNRITLENSIVTGSTHRTGTTFPHAQRAIPFSAFNNTFYIGASNSDVPIQTVTSGNWETPSLWSRGLLPSCNDAIYIIHDISVNADNGECKNLTVETNGKLNILESKLTVGCTLNNNPFTCNGTLNISGGEMLVNGVAIFNATATFNQNGGTLSLDWNNNGIVASSSSSTLLQILTNNLSLNEGKIVFIDPPAGTNTTYPIFSFAPPTAVTYSCGNNHAIQFGNGISTTVGGSAGGFDFTTFVTSKFNPSNLVVNTPIATNNIVNLKSTTVVKNNINITQGELKSTFPIFVKGNIQNDGILTLEQTLYLSDENAALVNTPQSISGNGTFRNKTTNSTGSFTNCFIYNTNSDGVTINAPIRISSTLALSPGIVNVAPNASLILGTTTAAGTLSLSSSYPTNARMIRGAFTRVFPANRTAAGTYTIATIYPIGVGTTYLPLYFDPATSSAGATSITAQAFNTNLGQAGLNISNLSNNRWEYTSTSNLVASNIRADVSTSLSTNTVFVQADSISGAYSILPNTINAVSGSLLTAYAFPVASMKKYLSYGIAPVCPAPSNQATNWITDVTNISDIAARFTPATSNPSGYLIVRYALNAATTVPSNNVFYAQGNTIGTGVVVYRGPNNTFSDVGLSSNTNYDYYVYSYNTGNCSGIVYNTTSPLKQTVKTCTIVVQSPTDLAVSSITPNQLVINWTLSVSNPSNQTLEVSTNSAFNTLLPNFPITLASSVKQYLVTGLSPNTTYYFRIKVLGSFSCTSSYTPTVSATTCNFVNNTTLNFEGSTVWGGDCWTAQKIQGFSGFQIGSNIGSSLINPPAAQGTNRLYFSTASSGSMNRLISPLINPNGKSHLDVSFQWYENELVSDPSQTLEGVIVQYSTDGITWIDVSSTIRVYGSSSKWVLKKLTIPTNNNSFMFVGFQFTAKSGYGLFMDDIKINPNDCNTAENPIISNLTHNVVNVTWSNPSTSVTEYDWEIRTSGEGGTGTTGLIAQGTTNQNSFSYSTLNSQTVYQIYLKSNCQSGLQSAWIGPMIIKTACAPQQLNTTTETFTSGIPSCWYKGNGALTTNTTLNLYSYNTWQIGNFGNTGTNQAIRVNPSGAGFDSWLISEPYDLERDGGIISYKFGVTGWGNSTAQTTLGANRIDVVVSTDNGLTWSSNNIIKTYTGVGNYSNIGTIETIKLSNYSGIIRIGFLVAARTSSPDIDFFIDDFSVTRLPSLKAKVYLNAYEDATLLPALLKTMPGFPTSDPYRNAPYNTSFVHVNNPANITINPSVLNATGNDAIVDWMFLELRSGNPGSTSVVFTKSVLIQKDGDLITPDGNNIITFSDASFDNYFLAIRHRSHLGFRTLDKVLLSNSPSILNFTNYSIPTNGTLTTVNFTRVMTGGDANSDGAIDAFDFVIWETQNGLFDDYQLNSDFNLDGASDAFDFLIWELNNGKFEDLN